MLIHIINEAVKIEMLLFANKPYANSKKNSLIAKTILETTIEYVDSLDKKMSWEEAKTAIIKELETIGG